MTALSKSSSFRSVAPCRVCLFGEHQDYLNLPVIAFAGPIHCCIHVSPLVDREDHGDTTLKLHVPSLNKTAIYNLRSLPPRQGPDTSNPDFALAAIHEAIDDGWILSSAEAISTTDIPMQAGCSSSTAFVVAWVQVLATLAGEVLTPVEVAQRAHQAEVTHFGAPGGTMDHVTISLGGLLRIGPAPWDYEIIPNPENGVWILSYSGEPKETLKHLKRCKSERLAVFEKLRHDWDSSAVQDLDNNELTLLQATRTNRNTEREAFQLWRSTAASGTNGKALGFLMSTHHGALRDGLGLSTVSLETMNRAALDAGAWGFKLSGSGGGGCGVAWASVDKAHNVRRALELCGAGPTWIIHEPSKGASVEFDMDKKKAS